MRFILNYVVIDEIDSETFDYSINNPLLMVYAFLLVLLISIYLKLFVFKSLKVKHVIFPPIFLLVIALIYWLLQTGNPLEITASIDGKYSCYRERYNYSGIIAKYTHLDRPGSYKYFLFDEGTQKILASMSVGWWNYKPDFYFCKFEEEENRFYFSDADYFDLPHSIDKDAIEEEEKYRKRVYLDYFIWISPKEKLIYNTSFYENDYYMPADFNYDSTSLIFIGNAITFKEALLIKSVDVSSLQVMHYSIGKDNGSVVILSPLEDKVYVMNGYTMQSYVVDTIDTKDYTYVSKMIFKNRQGKLFFIPYREAELKEIDIQVDEGSLQHVIDNYYTDKNGLYFFDPLNGVQKLESNDETINQKMVYGTIKKNAVLSGDYFIYGDAVYPYGKAPSVEEIRLDATRLGHFKLFRETYLGDDEKLLHLPINITYEIKPLHSPADVIPLGTPTEPVSEWSHFDKIHVRHKKRDKTIFYSSIRTFMTPESDYYLIRTPKHMFGISYIYDYSWPDKNEKPEAIKLKDVMIYNIDTRKHEPIETDKFRRLTKNFYIYKSNMYYTYSYPFETDINVDRLHPIMHNGNETEFYTDGECLLGGKDLGDLWAERKNGDIWYKFKRSPFRGVDWESLHIVTRSIMVDKNNLYLIEDGRYSRNNSVRDRLQVISIKDLGLDVKVVEVLK